MQRLSHKNTWSMLSRLQMLKLSGPVSQILQGFNKVK